jgi:hypothetical protein
MRSAKIVPAAVLLAAAAFAPLAHAINVDAGDFEVAPPGTNVFLLYYQHAVSNDSYAQGIRTPGDPRLTTDIGILRAVHYMQLGSFIAAPQVLLPFGRLDAGRDISELGSQTGTGDMILAFPVWFNQPGATSQFSIAPYLILPTGQYSRFDALNVGTNHSAFDLQAGYVQSLTDKISFDLVGDVQWNGSNTNYGSANQTLKQHNLYNLQTFLRYKFMPGADVRIGLQHVSGGTDYVDGISQNDRQSTNKIQFGGSYFFSPKQQITVTYGRDMSVQNGFKEANRLNLRFLQLL